MRHGTLICLLTLGAETAGENKHGSLKMSL